MRHRRARRRPGRGAEGGVGGLSSETLPILERMLEFRTVLEPSRATLRMQHRLLLLGLLGLWIVAAVLAYVGIAPLLPGAPISDGIAASVCGLILLVTWLWARTTVPRRPRAMAMEDYWQNPRVTAAVGLVLFLFEGVAMLGFVWTLTTGSWLGVAASLAGVAGLVVSGPGQFEQRVSL